MKEFKILGILDGSGSKYHRVFLTLKDLDGKVIKIGDEKREIRVTYKTCETNKQIITEEDVNDIDVLWTNWGITTPDVQISQLKSKYGFKTILDVDDVWDDKTHPYFIEGWEHFVVRGAILADYVTTTNNYLAAKLFKYNKNIAIIPNILPEGWGQFVGKPEEKKFNGKLRLGLFGSPSHIPDWRLFKSILNRLADNKNIINNCEFVLAGVAITEITQMFAKKKGIKLNLFPYKTPETYMELLDDVDVVMQPLVVNPHNLGKSALKIIESSVKDCVFLGSELYEGKEFTAYFKCEKPIDYEKTIELLLEKGNYEKLLEHTKTANLTDNKYEERVEFAKTLIEKVANTEKEVSDIKIWSLKYKEEQAGDFEEVLNPKREKGWRFEYNVMLDKLQDIKDGKEEYYGFLSWKFPYKTGIFKNLLFELLKDGKYQEADFINLSKKWWSSSKKYLEFSYHHHPKLEEILTKVLNNLNQPYQYSNTYTYSNFFLMKKENWVDYLENWVVPSLEYMENTIWDEVNIDANYGSGLPSEKLMESAGVEYYNYVTFVLERLIIFYTKSKNLKAINLI